jgi:hypothetical protein
VNDLVNMPGFDCWSQQGDGYFMVGDPVVPPDQCSPGGFGDDGLLAVVSGKALNRVQVGKKREGGKHDLLAVVPAQEAGTAEAADGR